MQLQPPKVNILAMVHSHSAYAYSVVVYKSPNNIDPGYWARLLTTVDKGIHWINHLSTGQLLSTG